MRRRDKEQAEEMVKQATQRMEKELEHERVKGEQKVEEANRRAQVDIKNAKEKMKLEQEEWREELLRKQQEKNKDYLRKLNEDLVKEKNQAISAVIEKLGDDNIDTLRQLQAQQEKKVREVENKWKSEMAEQRTQL